MTNSTNNCLVCNEAEETTNHLYSSQHFPSKNIRKQLMKKVNIWRKPSKMSPHVFNPFIKYLYTTLQQKPMHPPDSTRKSNIGYLIDLAIQEQYKIG